MLKLNLPCYESCVDLLDLKPDINDIARGLAHQPVLVGQTDRFFSQAQHAVLVSYLCDESHRYAGLMANAHIAYCGLVAEPVRQFLNSHLPSALDAIEYRVAASIRRFYGLQPAFPECVADADMRVRAQEIAFLCSSDQVMAYAASGLLPDYGKISDVWEPEFAYRMFLLRFREVSPFT